jgi:hypothetical protein
MVSPPEFLSGRVLARYPDGRVQDVDLGPGEWRPKNLHPTGRRIERIELSEEIDEDGNRRPLVVLSRIRF